ncbi:MAG TPA: TatD family hydrolase [Jiangellaceae bacterium]|jgi:TatD DNase family protein|nr:TatD family hydrolase [Jiangellaceae bacterium]
MIMGRDRAEHRERPPAPEPLPVPVTDTHCHLDVDLDRLWNGPEEALAAAAAVNVTRVVQIGCDQPGAKWAVDAAQRLPAIVAGVSVHPNEAPGLAASGQLDAALAEIDRLAGSTDRVRAVGETGLDYYRTGPDGHADQEASFRAHIEMARRHGKALVIHDRNAHDDVLRILGDRLLPDRVVFHCFSGDADMARYCAARGWFLSFAGTVTFANANVLRDALAATPLDRMLVETDAPFLTPHPHRGKPNGSYLVPLTVRMVSAVLGLDVEATCAALQRNTDAAFGPW